MKHYAVMVVLIYFVFVFTVLYLWINFLPRMEEIAEETSELVGDDEDLILIQEDAIPQLRIILLVSILAFGIVDDLFAVLLWKAKPPMRNERVFIPLYSVYIGHRFIGGFLIVELTILALTGTDPGFMINLLYLTMVVLSALSLVIIALVYTQVLDQKDTEGAVNNRPRDAPY
jgi:hypothetical protein